MRAHAGGRSGRVRWSRLIAIPDHGLGHDYACAVERRGGASAQLVPEVERFADSEAEVRVIWACQQPVPREALGFHGLRLLGRRAFQLAGARARRLGDRR